MDPDRLLWRFDGRARLLFQSLFSGVRGTSRAIQVFHRQRSSDPDILSACIDTLCLDEPRIDEDTLTLSLTPLVCLFPVGFKCGLLSFLHLIHSLVPRPCLIRLLDCLKQDPAQDPWIHVLLAQLCWDLGLEASFGGELFTPQCRTKVEQLCQSLDNGDRTSSSLVNATSSRSPGRPSLGPTAQLVLPLHGKRRNETSDLDLEEAGIQSKKRRLDLPATQEDNENTEVLPSEVRDMDLETAPPTVQNVDMGGSQEPQQSGPVGTSVVMPKHIQASVPQIKELLESRGEWDKESSSVLQVLHECDPSQAELLCTELHLSEIPEQILPQLCNSLLTLSPDLSQSIATVITRSLFYGKVFSLQDPPSRYLVTALTLFSSQYPRPVCTMLIGPILQAGQMNRVQAELLCRLIGDCLEHQYQVLVFGQTLNVMWNEDVLSVVHTLLDSRLELPEEIFSQLITQLCQQASDFCKSMKFAKMVITVLTKYPKNVSILHKQTLSSCLSSHETFLKKSLLAALKRIDPSW